MAKIRKQERIPDKTGAWDPAIRKGALSAISYPGGDTRIPTYEMQPDGHMMDPISGGFPPAPMPALGTETSNEQLSIEFPRTQAQQEAYYDEIAGNPYGI